MKRAPAKWVADNPAAYDNGIRSFWLNAFVSQWATWKSIVLKFLEAIGDTAKMQVVYNTCFGKLWENRGDIQDEDTLLGRREEYEAELPDGVLVLTAGIDTQDDRMEYEIKGHGHFNETWGIEKGIVMGRPDDDATWEQLDNLVFNRYFQFKDGIKLRVSMSFVDEGGHFTQEVRQRSRMLYMSSPIAASAINTNRTKVVGTGLTLKTAIDRDVLGLTPETAKKWQSQTEAEFRLWAENRRNCDALGMNNFYGLQQLALKSWLMSGDVFALIKRAQQTTKLNPYTLRLHLVEADRVSTPDTCGDVMNRWANITEGKNTNNGNKIYDGVEVDGSGLAVLVDADIGFLDAGAACALFDDADRQREVTVSQIDVGAGLALCLVAFHAEGFGLFCLCFRAVECVTAALAGADFVEALTLDDLKSVVPDSIVAGGVVGNDLICGSSDNDFQTGQAVEAVVLGEAVQQDADNLLAVRQINMGNLALTAAHRGGVDGVALGDILGDFSGEFLVDIDVLHFVSLLSFLPYSDKIEGGRGKAPGSPLLICGAEWRS